MSKFTLNQYVVKRSGKSFKNGQKVASVSKVGVVRYGEVRVVCTAGKYEHFMREDQLILFKDSKYAAVYQDLALKLGYKFYRGDKNVMTLELKEGTVFYTNISWLDFYDAINLEGSEAYIKSMMNAVMSSYYTTTVLAE